MATYLLCYKRFSRGFNISVVRNHKILNIILEVTTVLSDVKVNVLLIGINMKQFDLYIIYL